MSASALFPAPDSAEFALNIITVLMMYGPFYLANTGAMLFGKWIPDRFGFSSVVIDGGRNWKDGYRILGDGKTWNGMIRELVDDEIDICAAGLSITFDRAMATDFR